MASPVWQYTYDAVGNQITVKNPRTDVNATTTFEYDNLGRVTKRIDPFVAASGASPVWQYKYDAMGRQTEAIDPTNRKTVNVYNIGGQLTDTYLYGNTNQVESHSRFYYDPAGNLTASIDPRAFEPGAGPESAWTTTFAYNSRGQQKQIDRPDTVYGGVTQTHVSKTSYDQLGNVTDTYDESNRQMHFVYDVRNRLTSSTFVPLSQTTTTKYDDVGNVISVTDPIGQVSRSLNDELGRQTMAIDKLGYKTRTEYDAVGNVAKITDASGNITSYTYDNLNRLTKETTEGLVATRNYRIFEYDPAGNLVHYVNRNDYNQYVDYDELGRKSASAGRSRRSRHFRCWKSSITRTT